MTARNSSAWLTCSLYVALTVATLWPLGPSFASEFESNFIDLAEVHGFSEDPAEVSKTWEHGYVFVPGSFIGEFTYGKMASASIQSRLNEIPDDIHYPLIVYLHDAGGVSAKVYRLLKELDVENFAAVLPDSFARNGRKSDCEGRASNPDNCAMSPEVYLFRRAELIYAVRAASRLSWVDQDNVFLAGSGEGAVAVALWGGVVDVSGYIIIDWTCTAPAEFPWFNGLRVPSNRPTLVLTTSQSRWADMPGWDGNCAEKAEARANVDALAIDTSIRDVFGLREGKRAILEFLYANRRAHTN